MSVRKWGLAIVLLAVIGMGIPGCGGNPNEEAFRNSPPGKPFENPDDLKVSSRRERTRNVSKEVQAIEARNQGKKAKTP
jgi:hypothetical protein